MDTLTEADALIQRFEQQLSAFEKLHADEVKGMEEKLALYRQLHADEVKMLHEELARLKDEVETLKARAAKANEASPPAVAPVSRRELLLGWLPREK